MKKQRRLLVGEFVTIYPRGKKGIWTACFHYKKRHCRQSLGTRNEKRARGRAAELEVTLQSGGFMPKEREANREKVESLTVGQAKDEFIAFKKVESKRKKTTTKYGSILGAFVAFCVEHDAPLIANVTLRLFDKFRAKRSNEVGKRSVYNEFRSVKSFLKWCADRKLIAENPLAAMNLDRPRSKARGGPSLAQVNQILDKFTGYHRAALATLAFGGMRASECEHLLKREGDIDLEGNWISLVSRPGAETKTGNSWRVPIHPRLRTIIEELPKSNRHWYFTENRSYKFPDGDHHLNMKRLNEAFQNVLRELEIPAGKKNSGFTLHSLRSFFKTTCINAGIPREVVDKWQDHAGDHRPTASDGYYVLRDQESQAFMLRVPFGEGE